MGVAWREVSRALAGEKIFMHVFGPSGRTRSSNGARRTYISESSLALDVKVQAGLKVTQNRV